MATGVAPVRYKRSMHARLLRLLCSDRNCSGCAAYYLPSSDDIEYAYGPDGELRPVPSGGMLFDIVTPRDMIFAHLANVRFDLTDFTTPLFGPELGWILVDGAYTPKPNGALGYGTHAAKHEHRKTRRPTGKTAFAGKPMSTCRLYNSLCVPLYLECSRADCHQISVITEEVLLGIRQTM